MQEMNEIEPDLLPGAGGGEGGWYSGFQVTGMIECGQKSKPKKSFGTQTKPPKNSCTEI